MTTTVRVLGVDPGAKYTGVAVGFAGITANQQHIMGIEEASTYQTTTFLAEMLLTKYDPAIVVMEGFLLQPHANLAFDDLRVVRQLGVWEYLCAQRHIKLVEQLPAVKVPARAICKSRGLSMRPATEDASNGGDHHLDAQLHLWAWSLRSLTPRRLGLGRSETGWSETT